LHWCPTGVFTFVPLHAAGIYDGPDQECCMDYVVSSYTPTLAALLRAQRRCMQTFPVPESNILVIATNSSDRSDLPTLWNVEQEVENVVTIARNAGMTVEVECAPGLASAEVVPVLDSVQFAHIACHGIQHTTEPLESGFALSNGSLTVRQLMDLDLKSAFFAFLSACETAKGDEKQPDQTIHLAATMLFMGFKSVVATMW
jgi:CHAT domain-containing protein